MCEFVDITDKQIQDERRYLGMELSEIEKANTYYAKAICRWHKEYSLEVLRHRLHGALMFCEYNEVFKELDFLHDIASIKLFGDK